MTKSDFYLRVLRELQVVPPNGRALPEDETRVEQAYESAHAYLLNRRRVAWGLSEDIPDEFVLPMTLIVANIAAAEFALPELERSRLMRDGELDAIPASLAERMLLKLLEAPYVSSTLPNEYY